MTGVVSRLGLRVRRALHDMFARDVRIERGPVLKLGVRGLTWALLFSSWLTTVFDGVPGIPFPAPAQWVTFITAGGTVLLGGFVTDAAVKKHGVFEKLVVVAIIPSMVLVHAPGVELMVLASIVAAVLLGLLLIILFVNIIINTTVLNRARVVTLLLVLMVAIFLPANLLMLVMPDRSFAWVLSLVLVAGSMLVARRFPRLGTPSVRVAPPTGDVEDVTRPRMTWRRVRETGTVHIGVFMIVTSLALGFLVTDLFETTALATADLIVVVVVVIVSLPLISATLDTNGRKPATLLALLALGINVAFLEPHESPVITSVRLVLYVFFILLALILTVVLAGDYSSVFSRGKITGFFLFSTIIGAVTGVLVRNNMDVDVRDVSGLLVALVFVAITMFSTVKEPLQPSAVAWRDHLIRLHVITTAGLSIFREQFKDSMDDEGDLDGDLESGGLVGVQGMLQEISHSKKQVQVLDHGDTIIIFHHGVATIAVLFVEKDLLVFREKLANFHLDFERANPRLDPALVAVTPGLTRQARSLANKHFT